MSSYRPRGALARAVYEKVHNDDFLEDYDMTLVYIKKKHNEVLSC